MSEFPLPDADPRAPGRARDAGTAVKLDTIGWLLGLVLALVSIAMLAPLMLALALGEAWQPFGAAIAVEALVGGVLLLTLRHRARGLDHRSAFLAVALSWVMACLAGSVPYALSPDLGLPLVDALFESFSGFTTTGATVLSDLESKPRSLLLWRALTQWIGGMGVVLIGVAVLPILGIGGMALYKAEAPGPSKDKLVPRISETARILWSLYLGLTVLGIVALKLAGLSLFDAVCHAMCATATAGFSTHDASFGHFSSGWVRLTGMVLMVLGATSFAVLHRTLTRGIPWSASLELRAYVALLVIGSAILALDLRAERPEEFASTLEALDQASFQVVSIATTSGFTSTDYDAWPTFSKSLLFMLFFVGGMAGSTAGGVKLVRVVLLVRHALAQFFYLSHPRGVRSLKLDGRVVDGNTLQSVAAFAGMWGVLTLVGMLAFAATGLDMFSALSASAASLGNVGPGFAAVGPANTWQALAAEAKLIACVWMILGRLELYTVLVLFTPGFWKF